jgi:peptidoglycan hydrolase-like protein with peptidoglycan-binding domain
MDRTEKGTAVGATGGAVVGAAVGGPVGAAVGAGVGGYAGHYETQPGGLASNGAGTRYGRTAGTGMRYSENSETIRSVQQALNDQGYDVGAVDGQMGPDTQDALRRFQQAQNLPQTGEPDERTRAALGVSNLASNRPSAQSRPYQASNPTANQPSTPSSRYQASNHARNQYETQSRGMAPSGGGRIGSSESEDTTRSVQQALNDQGYNAGAVDGVMGPHTQSALRQFQQAQNLRQTGRPDARTLAALGVSGQAPNQASNRASVPEHEAPSEALNEPNAADESDQDLNQGTNQASNPANPSNPPSQGSNQASNESIPPDESVPSNASNPTNGPNPASNPPRR